MENKQAIYDTLVDIKLTLDIQLDVKINKDIRHIGLDEWVRLDVDTTKLRDMQNEIHKYM